MEHRLSKVRKFLADSQLDACLIIKPENRMYVSGFTGTSGMLLITQQQALLLTDFRYIEQATKQASLFEIVKHGTPAVDTLKQVIARSGVKRIAIESNYVTIQQYNEFTQNILDVEWIPVTIDKIRRVKDESEIAKIRKAVGIADAAFEHILPFIKPGVQEKDLALELETFMRRSGSEKNAFDFIVASGERSSLPHGVASDKIIQSGELLTMDYGCVYDHYHSDMTRTVAIGNVRSELYDLYRVVTQAQQAALQHIRPGLKGLEVDKIARDIITVNGYGEYFGHGLGHGVGLAIHEEPRLSPTDETVLEPGMVVTVEPGIYIPNVGGVRIEDMVLVTAAGCEILTQSRKDFIKV
jgi:Xaa-Pro aminopeptidase